MFWPSWASTFAPFEPLGLTLGFPWAPFGLILGPLGLPWAPLGVPRGSLGLLLGPSWRTLTSLWAHLGAPRVHLTPSETFWPSMTPFRGPHEPFWINFGIHFKQFWVRNGIECINPDQFEQMCLQNPPDCINPDKLWPFNLATLHPWTFILGTGLAGLPKGLQFRNCFKEQYPLAHSLASLARSLDRSWHFKSSFAFLGILSLS